MGGRALANHLLEDSNLLQLFNMRAKFVPLPGPHLKTLKSVPTRAVFIRACSR